MNGIDIYTDGACSGNPGAGGWAFVILNDGELLKGQGYEPSTTNNRMELSAPLFALKKVIELELIGLITVWSDSQYLVKGMTEWLKSWKQKNWKNAAKKPVKNRDLWESLDAFHNRLQPKWKWVKGHHTNPYNNLCDQMAVAMIENHGIL